MDKVMTPSLSYATNISLIYILNIKMSKVSVDLHTRLKKNK